MSADLKCPFAQVLISEQARCTKGVTVARRGGVDVSCQDAVASARCRTVHEGLLTTALEAVGMEYDLNQLPHSLLMKVQYGGLAALAKETGFTQPVEDVDQLVQAVVKKYQRSDRIDYERYQPEILSYKLKRRGRGNK